MMNNGDRLSMARDSSNTQRKQQKLNHLLPELYSSLSGFISLPIFRLPPGPIHSTTPPSLRDEDQHPKTIVPKLQLQFYRTI